MTIQYEKNIVEEKYLGSNSDLILKEVVPLLLDHNVIEGVENKHTRQANSKAWRLIVPIEDLLKYDGETSSNPFYKFWEEVNSK